MKIIYFAIFMIYFLCLLMAIFFVCIYLNFDVFVKLQGPVLEQLWLNRATLGKYVVNK